MQCGSCLSVALTFTYYALTLLSLLLDAKFSLLYITRQTDLELSLGCTDCGHGDKEPDISQKGSHVGCTTSFTFVLSSQGLLSGIKALTLAFLQGGSYCRAVSPYSGQPVFPPKVTSRFHSFLLMVPTSGLGIDSQLKTLTKDLMCLWAATNVVLHL